MKETMAKLKNIEDVLWQQLRHTHGILSETLAKGSYGDDEYDALRGALAMSVTMMEIDMDGDVDAFDELLIEGVRDCSCDGLCEPLLVALDELVEREEDSHDQRD